jgi:hypothetical protein
MRLLLAVLVGLAVGAAGYHRYVRHEAEATSPLFVMTEQLRTRAVIRHERQIAVWYRACPEVPGVNPQILVIWPGKLNYDLSLQAAELSLSGDVLTVRTPPVEIDEPAVPSDLGEYVAKSSIWTLADERDVVAREIRQASPLARHLSVWLLQADPTIEERFRSELADYLRGVAGALGVNVARVDVEIATAKRALPPRPAIELCEGTLAYANGLPFARRQADGTTVGIYGR